MNLTAYNLAFAQSHHSPGIRKMRQVLGKDRAITDFCVPVNIGFPPPEFMEKMQAELMDRLKYYPSEPEPLREKFAAFLNLPAKNLIAGNGSTELFYNILSAFEGKRRLMTCIPTFGRWTDAPRANGHLVVGLPRREENAFAMDIDEAIRLGNLNRIDTLVISNPNNPTGHLMYRDELLRMIERLRSEVRSLKLVVVDESFLDFSAHHDATTLLRDVETMDGLIVLKSLGKSFGLHGTRMGVLVANPRLVSQIENSVPYWNINGMAEAVIDLIPGFRAPFRASLDETIRATQAMRVVLSQIPGATTYATEANFVYVKFDSNLDPVALRDHLLIEHSLFVRSCGNKEGATARHFRMATRPAGEVGRLINAVMEFTAIR